MNGNHLFVTLCFGAGVLSLLGWAYLTIDRPRSNQLLVKSIWLFVLPGAAIVALPNSLFLFPLSMWALVFVEECLKAFASRTKVSSLDRFWLIVLFGIWELMLVKSMRPFTDDFVLSHWHRFEVLGLVVAACGAVLMHTVTAAIYAFHFQRKTWAALGTCWAIHTIYNEVMSLFPLFWALCAVIFILLLLLIVLWPDLEQDGLSANPY
ncbi:hypothetical protein [Sphingosinicella rhizophila]|uniref:Protease prsW family protein n=1 Tax=Sphingosinicella rhizophila TaxID=3050082 RepID=A0ABU3Q9E2_9SPHN|nr:hypothetical protein [Sphingosinicella sp. GR2756]MDT9600009.1 hypothetical protein [Sphingosinicella sp. GR2756]